MFRVLAITGLAALLSAFPARAQAPPSIGTLLAGVIARDAQTQRELKTMAYDEEVVTERLDASGRATQRQDLRLTVRPGAQPELQVVSVKGDNLPSDPEAAAQQARGQEAQRRQQTLDLKSIATRFNLALQGSSTEFGALAYVVAFAPKSNQPANTQVEKVLNQLQGRIWVRASDDTILRTVATLGRPVSVAWFLASVSKLDFDYELLPGGNEYGPARLRMLVDVRAPLIWIIQRQDIAMDHFRPR